MPKTPETNAHEDGRPELDDQATTGNAARTTGDEGAGIASALIRARNELGLSQAQLAGTSGVSRSAIKGYESGRNMPGARELKALCHVLRVSPTELLYGSEDAFRGRSGSGPGDFGMRDLDISRARWRLHAITSLLAIDEVAALSKLARAIAVARHGVERLDKVVRVGDSVGALAPTGTPLGAAFDQIDSFVAALDADAAVHADLKKIDRLLAAVDAGTATPADLKEIDRLLASGGVEAVAHKNLSRQPKADGTE